MQPMSTAKSGFTLVEMVVIAPLILLLIGALVSAAITVSDSAMRSQAKSQLRLDVLSALDRMEQDVKLSTSFDESGSGKIKLESLATDKNPMSTSRKLVDKSTCNSVTGGAAMDTLLTYEVAYEVSGSNDLIRSISLPTGCARTSSNVWQKHENNETLIDNTEGVNITVAVDTSASGVPALAIQLTATRKIDRRNVSYTGYMYATSVNIR